MPGHDNTNRGAAWATKAVKGTLDVGGRKFYVDIVQTGRDSPAPTYNIYAASEKSRVLYGCGLFAPKNDSKAKAKGVLNLHDEGGEQWVNLFVNKPDAEHPNRPLVALTVQAKDPEPQAPAEEARPDDQPGGDKIPF